MPKDSNRHLNGHVPTEVTATTRTSARYACMACEEPITEPRNCWVFCDACVKLIADGRDPLEHKTSGNVNAQISESQSHRLFVARLTADFLKKVFAEEKKIGSKRFICSACNEEYVLPTQCFPCRHSFCELCLRKLASETLEDGHLASLCPVCKQAIHYTKANKELQSEMRNSTKMLDSSYDKKIRELIYPQEKAYKLPLPSLPLLHQFHKFYMRLPKPTTSQLIHQCHCAHGLSTPNTLCGRILDWHMLLYCLVFIPLMSWSAASHYQSSVNYTIPVANKTNLLQNASYENYTQGNPLAGVGSRNTGDFLVFPLHVFLIMLIQLGTLRLADLAVVVSDDLHLPSKSSLAIAIISGLIHASPYFYLSFVADTFLKEHSYGLECWIVFAATWCVIAFICIGNLVWRRSYARKHGSEEDGLEDLRHVRLQLLRNLEPRQALESLATEMNLGAGQMQLGADASPSVLGKVQLSISDRGSGFEVLVIRAKNLVLPQVPIIAPGRQMLLQNINDFIRDAPASQMVALYDYDPRVSSPNADAEQMELAFRAGEIITVYGGMDEDGFFVGEIDGRRGLVPSNFLASDMAAAGGDALARFLSASAPLATKGIGSRSEH